MILRVVIKKYF